MHLERIAELLAPFLSGATDTNLQAANVYRSENQNGGHFDECGNEQPAVLTFAQLQNISTYIDILLRWNARINLTSIRDPEEIVKRHFGESFFAARHLFPSRNRQGHALEGHALERHALNYVDASRTTEPESAPQEAPGARPTLADIGSGAGFPGIPIKLWAPEISLTLIESSHKKAAFLGEVIRSLILTNINVRNTRAESIVGSRFDVVTLRAVERFDAILPIAARLIAPAGRLALLIGASQLERALTVLPSLSWSPPMPIPLSDSRILMVGGLLSLSRESFRSR